MRAFAELYAALDETTKTGEKVAALRRYFAAAPPADAAWALYFLSGRKPRQLVSTRRLSEWAIGAAGLPEWLFSECYDAVGDFAETVALLLPEREVEGGPGAEGPLPGEHPPGGSLAYWIEERLLPLRGADEEAQRSALLQAWAELDRPQRFLWNKLLTGGFRVGVAQGLVTKALALVSGVEDTAIAHRLMGDWEPSAAWYAALLAPETADSDLSRPYPFCLAHPLEGGPEGLGDPAGWQAEWKWDGIRAQLIRRGGQTFLWSRGEELISERFPELAALGELLPDGTVIDGEILPFKDGAVLPFAQLQRRIGRKTLGRKILAEVPAALFAYDLLEAGGQDIRALSLEERRRRLEEVFAGVATKSAASTRDPAQPAEPPPESSEPRGLQPAPLRLSPIAPGASWEEVAAARDRSRELGAEGLMLKRRGSPYRVGRVKGDWWKWKVEPYSVDAVLIYAQRGSGKRASLYTDYTFGIWDGEELVPFAKAYSGLTDAEIREVDALIRRSTLEKFGPVRTVRPELVFELAFEGIQRSPRHKSGLAVRFPRILRWRRDKPPREADSIETVRALLEA